MANTTVTISSHYAFLSTLSNAEEISATEDDYGIAINKLDDGSFEVTGPYRSVNSFVDDICIGDKRSVAAIMKTAR